MYNLYVASCEKNGGVYRYQTDGKNTVLKQFVPLDRPMYLLLSENKMYAVLREYEERTSAVVSFDLDSEGNLVNPSEIISTQGEVGCHIEVCDERFFVAHYTSGSLFASPNTNLKFPQNSKLHFICKTYDDNFLLCDLGLDKIYLLDKNLSVVSQTKLKDGSGPRHLCFDESGKFVFCACELSSEVVSFEYKGEKLYTMDVLPTAPDFSGENYPAAIRCDKNTLYVSNRGENSIAVFDVKGNNLTHKTTFETHGKHPRDFFIKDDLLVCANLESDNVCFFEKECYKYISQIEIKSPISVVIS